MSEREKHLKRVAKDREEGLEGLLNAQDRKKKPKTHQMRVCDWSEKLFADKLMSLLPLKSKKTRALDMAGTDRLLTFELLPTREGVGKIHVQIKASNLREYPNGLRYWKFRIIRKNKKLDEELWSRSDFFLGLVLSWCHPDEFTGDEPPPGTKCLELMIPGKNVVEYFRKHPKAKHIRLMKISFDDGKYKVLKGADDLHAILSGQMEGQREGALEDMRRLWPMEEDEEDYWETMGKQ